MVDLEPATLHPPPELIIPGDDAPTAPQACAFRLHAADGVGLRLALWRGPSCRATILIFPGRTEYAEKYHRVADWLVARGHAVLAIDWRGQGASDRLIDNRAAGHVDDFSSYQLDVAAMRLAAGRLELPRPFHLLCHSMGGAIGLRALHRGLDVQSVVFSAPMWGIRIGRLPEWLGPGLARFLSHIAGRVGLSEWQLPGRGLPPADPHDREALFRDNPLTSDPEWWEWVGRLNQALPAQMIGPPTLAWLHAALSECKALAALPAPATPALISLSGAETIISNTAVHRYAFRWPAARLLALAGARHEALFEQPEIRATLLRSACDHFDHGDPRTPPHPPEQGVLETHRHHRA